MLRRLIALVLASFLAAAPARAVDPQVPYIPTPPELVEQMLDLAQVHRGDYLIDLGCGDGRIPIAAARRGASALGVDIDVARIREALLNLQMAQVQNRVIFRREDLFQTPIYEASVVTLYLLQDVNLRLRPRLLTELHPGTRIVSHSFDMGDWRPDVTRDQPEGRIFLWIVPAVADGDWWLRLADGQAVQLHFDQHFQDATGTASGPAGETPLRDIAIRGPHIAFTANLAGGARVFHGIIDGASITPEGGAGGEPGWRATRAD